MKPRILRLPIAGLTALLIAACGSDRPAATGKQPAPDPVDPVTLSFQADPVSGEAGTVFMLSWETTGAEGCSASGAWTGTRPATGSEAVSPAAGTHDHTLECTGPGGTERRTVTIVVTAVPDPSDPFAESKAEFERLRELEARTETGSP
jgi:hypothetical protein